MQTMLVLLKKSLDAINIGTCPALLSCKLLLLCCKLLHTLCERPPPDHYFFKTHFGKLVFLSRYYCQHTWGKIRHRDFCLWSFSQEQILNRLVLWSLQKEIDFNWIDWTWKFVLKALPFLSLNSKWWHQQLPDGEMKEMVVHTFWGSKIEYLLQIVQTSKN